LQVSALENFGMARQNSKAMAMRGSRPGERRGGRKKGTPNRKTAYTRAVMAAHSANPNVTPMDVMLAVMRDPHVALDMRVKVALKALPHLHRKLPAGETACVTDAQSLAHLRDKKLSPQPEHVNGRSIATHQDAKMKNNGVAGYRQESSIKSRKGASESSASANVRVAAREGDKYAGLMPLPFLLEILNDEKTPANLKVKVSLATLPYTHPRQSKREKQAVVADRHGFTVDRALATKLRNEIARVSALKKRRNPRPQDRKTMQRLQEKIRAKLITLQCPCPSQYRARDAAKDRERVLYLGHKRRSRAKLTPNEDAELAHVTARYWSYGFGPEAHARERLNVLKNKERIDQLTPSEKGRFRALTILYPPETPKPTADREAFLESDSIFSDGLVDADGFPVEYTDVIG
jgi:hypothetical protein